MTETVEKKFFANIVRCKGNINKRWYVAYYQPDFDSGGMVRKKIYGDINKFKTVEERLAAAQALLARVEAGDQDLFTRKGSRRQETPNEAGLLTSIIHQVDRVLEMQRHRVRASSYASYKSKLKQFKLWLHSRCMQQMPVGKFGVTEAREFLIHLVEVEKLSTTTHNVYINILKTVWNILHDEQIVHTNPWALVKPFPRSVLPALYFQRHQIEILRNEIPRRDPQLWLFVQFIYYCFLRPGELRQMKIGDILFEEGKIIVRKEISKNKKQQFVAIPAQMSATLHWYNLQSAAPGHYIFSAHGVPGNYMVAINHFKRAHRAILQNLKFSDRHKLYSWKHTGAVECAKAGMPLKDMQLQLRHHSLDQVDMYLRDLGVMDMIRLKDNYPSI